MLRGGGDYRRRYNTYRSEVEVKPESSRALAGYPGQFWVRTFISEGYAASYKGMVDVITAGFPCQPFSIAGKRGGEGDHRNMWPETIECIRIIRPKYVLLENVPSLLADKYVQRIFGDLAASGYDARWACLDAKSEGAPIKRERLFIACTDSTDGQTRMGHFENGQITIFSGRTEQCPSFWLQTPSEYIGMVNGVADYLDRVKAVGNGQVPQVVRTAWRYLAL